MVNFLDKLVSESFLRLLYCICELCLKASDLQDAFYSKNEYFLLLNRAYYLFLFVYFY